VRNDLIRCSGYIVIHSQIDFYIFIRIGFNPERTIARDSDYPPVFKISAPDDPAAQTANTLLLKEPLVPVDLRTGRSVSYKLHASDLMSDGDVKTHA
jgi:hypothetical protein